MDHWTFILGAYGLVYGTLLIYWWRVEHAVRMLEAGPASPARGSRP